jgi:hypothetical protein
MQRRVSYEYRYGRVSLNRKQMRLGEDGSYRIVIAHRDPGVPNWLDTAGHDRGTMGLRWVKAAHHPRPRTRVLPLDALR